MPTKNVITIMGRNTQTLIFGSISNSVILKQFMKYEYDGTKSLTNKSFEFY